jgi:TMEM175 potassium channel family protein
MENQDKVDRGTHRVEAFSDGFFAIVITLLVLDLRLPEAGSGDEAKPVGQQLFDLWPVLLAYIVSFINIYILWVSHHELMRITTKADTGFLYLNGGLLLGVAIMPFSTSVLADHFATAGVSAPAALYTGALLWVALFFNLLWRYLCARPERVLSTVSRHDRRRISRTQTVTLVLYLAAFGLAWIAPTVSIAVTLALAVFLAVVDRLSGFASEDVAEEA